MAEFTANDKWVNSELAKTLNFKLALTDGHRSSQKPTSSEASFRHRLQTVNNQKL